MIEDIKTHRISKRTRNQRRPRDLIFLRLQIIHNSLLALEQRRQLPDPRIGSVVAKLAGDEALDARCEGGVDELLLLEEGALSHEADDGVLAREGGLQ